MRLPAVRAGVSQGASLRATRSAELAERGVFPRAESALPVAELVSAAERRVPYLDNIVTPAVSGVAVAVAYRAAPRRFW